MQKTQTTLTREAFWRHSVRCHQHPPRNAASHQPGTFRFVHLWRFWLECDLTRFCYDDFLISWHYHAHQHDWSDVARGGRARKRQPQRVAHNHWKWSLSYDTTLVQNTLIAIALVLARPWGSRLPSHQSKPWNHDCAFPQQALKFSFAPKALQKQQTTFICAFGTRKHGQTILCSSSSGKLSAAAHSSDGTTYVSTLFTYWCIACK